MTDNVLEETLMSGGGALSSSPHKEKLCAAFRAAVPKFCAGPPGTKFNDYFYDELKDVGKYGDLASQITREVPVLMKAGGTVAATVGGLGAVAETDAWQAIVKAGGGVNAATAAPGAADASANAAFGMFKRVGGQGSGFYPRFLDGQMGDGSVLEIKGPGDTFHGSQAKDLKTINGKKDPAVVSCESCAPAPCVNAGGGRRGCR